MPPAKSLTNFRSYEAQARLLAAVIATCNPKLNYKEIADHIGSDATTSSVDHRLRPLKQLAKLQVACVKEGKDPKTLPVEKAEIQKLFGESTAAGLEFHFREVKATGKAQQEAVDNGQDSALVPVGKEMRALTAATKGKGKIVAPLTPTTNRKRAASTKTTAATTGGRVRKQQRIEQEHADAFSEEENSMDSGEYDDRDLDTPSKPRARADRIPAYTVNNSTTNSDTEMPMPAIKSYAQTQAENQARARVEYPEYHAEYKPHARVETPKVHAQASRDHEQTGYDAQSAPAARSYKQLPQRRNISGGRNPNPPPPPAEDDDELMEIPAHQFPAHANTNANQGRQNQASYDALDVIKKDPFESDAGDASDYLDPTATARQRTQEWRNTPDHHAPPSYQDNQEHVAYEFDDAYDDGEV